MNSYDQKAVEFMIASRYILTKYIALSTHYDGDMKWGCVLQLSINFKMKLPEDRAKDKNELHLGDTSNLKRMEVLNINKI